MAHVHVTWIAPYASDCPAQRQASERSGVNPVEGVTPGVALSPTLGATPGVALSSFLAAKARGQRSYPVWVLQDGALAAAGVVEVLGTG